MKNHHFFLYKYINFPFDKEDKKESLLILTAILI